MALAYVKMLEGVNQGKKKKIPVISIKPPLVGLDFDPSKKYLFNGSKMRILETAESEPELDLKATNVSSRKSNLPDYALETATSSLSDADLLPSVSKSKNFTRKTKKGKHLAAFAKTMNMTVVNVEDILNSQMSDNDIRSNQLITDKTKLDPIVDPLKNSVSNDVNSFKQKHVDSGQRPEDKGTIQITVKDDKKQVDEKVIGTSKKNWQRKYDNLDKDYTKLERKYDALKADHEKLKEIISKQEELNEKLQKQVIDKFDQFFAVQQNLEATNKQESIDPVLNFPAVGTSRLSDNQISIGWGQWISLAAYTDIRVKSKTPTAFINKIIPTLYTEQELLTSTVTGGSSNRSVLKVEYDKLDPTRLQICKDFYKDWLFKEYKIVKKSTDKKTLEEHYSNFLEYVSKKISYIKNPPKPKKRSKDESEDTDYTEHESVESRKKLKTKLIDDSKSYKIRNDNEDGENEIEKDHEENIEKHSEESKEKDDGKGKVKHSEDDKEKADERIEIASNRTDLDQLKNDFATDDISGPETISSDSE